MWNHSGCKLWEIHSMLCAWSKHDLVCRTCAPQLIDKDLHCFYFLTFSILQWQATYWLHLIFQREKMVGLHLSEKFCFLVQVSVSIQYCILMCKNSSLIFVLDICSTSVWPKSVCTERFFLSFSVKVVFCSLTSMITVPLVSWIIYVYIMW